MILRSHEQFIAKHYRSLMEETRKRTVRKAEVGMDATEALLNP